MMTSLSKKILIGIDPGINTGIAVFNPETKMLVLRTVKIHQGFQEIDQLLACKFDISVTIEDPNLWTRFSANDKTAKSRLQGAGSVKRDFSAWRDFLTDKGIPFTALRPDKTRNSFAKNIDLFKKITGYSKVCSEHARVAAMLVWK